MLIASSQPAVMAGWVQQLQFDWSRVGMTSLRVLLIMVAAWLLVALLQRAIRTFRERIASRLSDPESIKRADTLGRVFRYLVAVAVSALAGMLVLSELGIALAPILGAAGVVGLAIGFGAQSLVKDYFTGFFILFEDQIRQGDVVTVADHSGLVEEITLRHVRLRDYDGNVHYVPNGMITSVVNMSRGFAFAVIDVSVAYREDVEAALQVMRRVGSELRTHPDFTSRILEDIEVVGVERLEDSGVVLRCRMKVAPLEQWTVRREYFKRIKAAFEQAGIEIPYPHMTLYAGAARDGSAPPFTVRQSSETEGERSEPLRARAAGAR